MIAEISSLTR